MVTVDDGSDTCVLRFFNFYPSQQKALAVGTRVRVRGELQGRLSRLADDASRRSRPPAGELPAALTPVYSTSAGLPQAYLRKAVLSGLARADLVRHLPAGRTETLRPPVWSLREALTFLHHPAPDVAMATLEDHSHPAWQRLKAEELLAQQLSQLQSKRARASRCASPALERRSRRGLHEQLLAALPFAADRRRSSAWATRSPATWRAAFRCTGCCRATSARARPWWPRSRRRIAIDAGWQCALMAPTEILAEQHFRKLIGWLEPLLRPARPARGLADRQPEEEGARRDARPLVASGEAALVVGTHAVIQEQVQFRNLGAGHHRRAAPLRRRPAAGAARQRCRRPGRNLIC